MNASLFLRPVLYDSFTSNIKGSLCVLLPLNITKTYNIVYWKYYKVLLILSTIYFCLRVILRAYGPFTDPFPSYAVRKYLSRDLSGPSGCPASTCRRHPRWSAATAKTRFESERQRAS